MEKFYYNGVTVDSKSVQLFPNIETLHIYNEDDEYLCGGRIQRYVNWNRISYNEYLEDQRKNGDKEIEYKRIVWTYEDTEIEIDKQYPDYDEEEFDFIIRIPEGVKEIDENGLGFYYLRELTIPSTVKTIPKNCISNCDDLTNITFPLNESQMIIGNKIFNTPHLEQDIYLPNYIQMINGNEVKQLTSFEIPTTVTSLDEECFYRCFDLEELTIPTTVKTIPKNCIEECWCLTNITLPINESQMIIGIKIFNTPHLEQEIYLPYDIQMINGEEVDTLTSFEIPTTITSLDEDCFYGCYKLVELIIPETVKTIPKYCICNCVNLTNITFPLNESQMIIGNKIFKNQSHLEQTIYLPNSIRSLNGEEVDRLTSFEIPTIVTSFDEECFSECNYLKQIIIPETITNIPMKTFMKLPELEELTIRTNKYELNGNRIFYNENECLYSIQFPTTIKKVNNEEVHQLETYTIPSNVTKLSEYCFANCEELREIKGIENVKEIGKGCFYRCKKLKLEEYPEVKKNKEEYFNETVKEDHRYQVEEWTGLKCNEILFDSDVDDWSENTSVFNDRIIGKKQLTFIIEDEEGEIFGYYLNTEIIEEYEEIQATDSKSFKFNLESQNNRLKEPMKFEIKDMKKGGIYLWKKSDKYLINLGNIILLKENYKNGSDCLQFEDFFDYHGIENALCGKEPVVDGDMYFTPKRILVIQMK